MKTPALIGVGAAAGFVVALLLLKGCERDPVETTKVTRTLDTMYVAQPPDTVRIPEAYAVIRYRDRRIVAQVDSITRDTVLVCEPFMATFSERDTSNGATVRGAIQFPLLRVTDLIVSCPVDSTMIIKDSVTIETVIERKAKLALGIGPFAGVAIDATSGAMSLRYGAGVSLTYILGSW